MGLIAAGRWDSTCVDGMLTMDEEAFKTDIARRAVQDPAFRAALLSDPKGTVERALGQPLAATCYLIPLSLRFRDR